MGVVHRRRICGQPGPSHRPLGLRRIAGIAAARTDLAVVVATVVTVAMAAVVAVPSPAVAWQGNEIPPSDRVEVDYRPPTPVPEAVVDPFRPPGQPWAPGNRGVDYATDPGALVVSSAAGEVVFAGDVAGALHVTVAHRDGLRTSYSFLASVSVAVGQSVHGGDVVGTSAGRFHFGVRDQTGAYLDPTTLMAAVVVRLVPGGDDGAVVVAGPGGFDAWAVVRDVLVNGVALAGGPGVAVLPELAGVAPVLSHYGAGLAGGASLRSALAAMAAELGDQGPCTPAAESPPAPTGRRIMVLVAGFGSSSNATGIDNVDAASLGYQPDDVLRFSYRGGRIPPPQADSGPTGSGLGTITTSTYASSDALGDLPTAGGDLVQLLAEVAEAAPGVPIDVVAHSQGGVVARLGIAAAAETGDLPVEVSNLVTLGSPHHGADLATAGAAIASTPRGAAALDLAGALGLPVSGRSQALGQLSELSVVSANPGGAGPLTPMPETVRFTSVAARGDPVVPVQRTAVPGAVTTTVSLLGVTAHDDLPGSPAATREIGLAVAGRPPTCRSTTDRMVDQLVGHGVSGAHDAAGASLVALALVL
jgi:hypothetical protein